MFTSSRNFRPTWVGSWLTKYFSDMRYVNPVRGYSKFHENRLRDLGEHVANGKKHHGQSMRPAVTIVPGGLNSSIISSLRLSVSETSVCNSADTQQSTIQ